MQLLRSLAVFSIICFGGLTTSIVCAQQAAPAQPISPTSSAYVPATSYQHQTPQTQQYPQSYSRPSFSGQPIQQQPMQQSQARQEPFQQQTNTQQPIRMQTLQTPPKSITHNGITVYQQASQQSNPPSPTPQAGQENGQGNTASNRTMPPGFGSPYPTGTTLVASTQPEANRPAGAVYGMPAAPAQSQPGYASGSAAVMPPAISAVSTPPGPTNPSQPQPLSTGQTQLVHKGRAAPEKRIEPFALTAQEQQELDEFLVRWEKYSENIKRYEIDFTSYYYDPSIQRLHPGDIGKPVLTTFGFFKYVAPSRFVFQVEGEWVNGKKVSRDKQSENEQPKVYAEKIIIDEKSVFYYDYNAKTVKQINIPAEMIGKGIADSPLPLIFGAKAEDMKKRFFLKLVTAEQARETQIWLQARPRFIEDQQEFLQIEIRLDRKTLRAAALKKDDINGQAHTVYVFNDPKVNPLFDLEMLRTVFTPSTPRGWKHVVEEMPRMLAEQSPQRPISPQGQPNGVPGITGTAPNTAPAVPHGNVAAPAQRNEIPLYNP